jgi:hypothetical protein
MAEVFVFRSIEFIKSNDIIKRNQCFYKKTRMNNNIKNLKKVAISYGAFEPVSPNFCISSCALHLL